MNENGESTGGGGLPERDNADAIAGDEGPGEPPAIVIYMVDPFSYGVDNPELLRLSSLALMRCFSNTVADERLPSDALRQSLYLQTISLESIYSITGELSPVSTSSNIFVQVKLVARECQALCPLRAALLVVGQICCSGENKIIVNFNHYNKHYHACSPQGSVHVCLHPEPATSGVQHFHQDSDRVRPRQWGRAVSQGCRAEARAGEAPLHTTLRAGSA